MTKAIKQKKQPTRQNNEPYHTIGLGIIFRNNEKTIVDLLKSVEGLFDQIAFTDTGCTDSTRDLIENWIKQHKNTESAKITNFEWCDDFAKARNFNFNQLNTRWKGFLDTDDVLIKGEDLRTIINKIEAGAPHIDGLFVEYDYDNMERLDTARFCRGQWHWEDAIHERLVANGDKGKVERFARAKGVVVKHAPKEPEDKEKALERNSRIALKEYGTTTDPAYKARLCRTIAMALKKELRFSEAKKYLEELVKYHGHLPEGREAYADLMRIEVTDGDGKVPTIEYIPPQERLQQALKYAKRAGPSYEALVYRDMGDFEKCIQRQSVGIYQPRQTTHECDIVQYGSAQAVLADAAMRQGYSPEAVENAINFIPTQWRNNETMGGIIQAIRASIDRITIIVPGTPQPFDEDSTKGMLGGSEEAVVYLSNSLAKAGRNVRVFGILPPLRVPGVGPTGVDYQHFKSFNVEEEHGTVVVWRSLEVLDNIFYAKLVAMEKIKNGDRDARLPTGISQVFYWAHDQSTNAPPDVSEKLLSLCNGVIVLSEFHKKMLSRGMKNPENIKWVILSNGVVGEQLKRHRVHYSEKDPHKVVYSSCPTRGLVTLLNMWSDVKEAVPEATLDIYYDWEGLRNAAPEKYHALTEHVTALNESGLAVRHLGGVGHDELYAATSRARVLAYAHFENTNVETFCISAVKTNSLKTMLLTVSNGALPEVAPESNFKNTEAEYKAELIRLLKTPPTQEEDEMLEGIGNRAIERFDWDAVAKRFGEVWTQRLPETKTQQ